jgi:hypothetical protein
VFESQGGQSVSIFILTHLSKIAWSLKVNKSDELRALLAQHKNIYQAIVKGSQCSINVVLCARIANLPSWYVFNVSVVLILAYSVLFISNILVPSSGTRWTDVSRGSAEWAETTPRKLQSTAL